jgi:hypothetical protein
MISTSFISCTQAGLLRLLPNMQRKMTKWIVSVRKLVVVTVELQQRLTMDRLVDRVVVR